MPVEQVVEDLPVGVSGAAIHDVAARDADGRLRVSGRNFHLSGWPSFVEIERIDTFGYGVTTYIVLPTTSGCPSWPRSTPVEKVHAACRFFAFAGGDLRQLAVARWSVVLARHGPLRIVLGRVRLTLGFGRVARAEGQGCCKGDSEPVYGFHVGAFSARASAGDTIGDISPAQPGCYRAG